MEVMGGWAAVSGYNWLIFTKQLSMTVSSITVRPVWICGLFVRCYPVIMNQLLFLDHSKACLPVTLTNGLMAQLYQCYNNWLVVLG